MSGKTHVLFDRHAVKNGAPNFDKIKTEDFLPAVEDGIAIARDRIKAIKANKAKPDFKNTILALETADEELGDTLSVFFNLLSADTNDDLQKLAQKVGPLQANFGNDITLDADLFKRIDAVWNDRANQSLTPEQSTILEKTWKNFVRNGAKLNDKDKEKLRKIDEELSVLSPQYSENVLKSTNAFQYVIDDAKRLAGIPANVVAAAKEKAEEKGLQNKWAFTLDAPCYVPTVTYAADRDLREAMWRGSANRAFKDGNDNQELIRKIVTLRHERANLLGYSTHADYVLERRMAKTKEEVFGFLDKLVKSAKPSAEEDLKKIRKLAKDTDGLTDLKPWDLSYYAEKLKQKEYDFDTEELRPYFELDKVVQGVFDHASILFGIEAKESKAYPVYNKDVRTFEIFDKDSGDFYGVLYTDFFPRAGKKSGAWMTSFRDRGLNKDGGMDCPLISIVCNFTKPTKGEPSLISLDEVETLFHEFGHALHGMLTKVEHKSVSGTSVLWDFVELPSQIMENWLVHKETHDLFSRHYKTGDKIPADMLQKLKDAQNFMAGWGVMRQAGMGLLDMKWHTADPKTIKDIEQFEIDAMKETTLIPREPSCTSASFGHIFSGGYSAGYYSYFWAEVLDADAFEVFLDKGLYDEKTGREFRDKILAKGGSAEPMDLFIDFRGRKPDPDALLRKRGLIGPKAA